MIDQDADDQLPDKRAQAMSRALERNKSGKPVLLWSAQINDSHRRAAGGLAPAGCSARYLGRGRKLVVLFPFADREKLVIGEKTGSDGKPNGSPMYLNPLAPPDGPVAPPSIRTPHLLCSGSCYCSCSCKA